MPCPWSEKHIGNWTLTWPGKKRAYNHAVTNGLIKLAYRWKNHTLYILTYKLLNKCTNKHQSISHCHCHSFVDTSLEGFNFGIYYQFGKVIFHYFFDSHYEYIYKIIITIDRCCLKWLSQVKFSRKCGTAHIAMPHSSKLNITRTTTAKTDMADGGNLGFLYLDSSKYKNDARNGLFMPHLVGKVVLHGFLSPFVFK